MIRPPFQRLDEKAEATRELFGLPLHNAAACCDSHALNGKPAAPERTARRVRLSELDTNLHCSIIGTCLTLSELRRLVPRFVPVDRKSATDLDIHHEAVQLAVDGGEASKALSKALDERHAMAIRQYRDARDEAQLIDMWDASLKKGDVASAYWAIMSHPVATLDVRQRVFGDVHMLSHLVGAANRADIRRLVELEAENAALQDKLDDQQSRAHEAAYRHEQQLRAAQAQIADLETAAERAPLTSDHELAEKLRELSERVVAAEANAALQNQRRETAEARAQSLEAELDGLRQSLDQTSALAETLDAEAGAIERTMLMALDRNTSREAAFDALKGKTVVYVGGRPGSNLVLRSLVEEAGGHFSTHDGGLEDRKALLASAIARADVVFFPVDCIDHDSMNTIKRVCDRHAVPFHPLRTASIASFAKAVAAAA